MEGWSHSSALIITIAAETMNYKSLNGFACLGINQPD